MEIIKSLLILMILVGLGALSRRTNVFKKGDVKVLSSFVFYFSLPALFLVKISKMDLTGLDPVLIFGSVLPILLVFIALIIVHSTGLIKRDKFILLSLSVVMGSNAFFGLAFFEFFKEGYHYANAIVSASFLGAMGIVLSLVIFEFSKEKASITKIIASLRKNPLLISIAVGVIFSLIGFSDSFFHSSFEILGNASGSIAVFSLGIFLFDKLSMKNLVSSLGYAFFRFIALAIGVVSILTFFHVFSVDLPSFDLKQFLLLQASIPAAVSLVIFAERYNYKVVEITGMVIATSLLSFIVMIVNYYLSYLLF